jgi:hypothetical protein
MLTTLPRHRMPRVCKWRKFPVEPTPEPVTLEPVRSPYLVRAKIETDQMVGRIERTPEFLDACNRYFRACSEGR